MNKTEPTLRHAVRILPEQVYQVELEDSDLLIYIELSKNPSDPYIRVRFEQRRVISRLSESQRN